MVTRFKKTGIIYNPDIKEAFELADKIQKKIQNSLVFSLVNLDENFDENFNEIIDLAIVIGGDGTFLKAARFLSSTSIPVLGFNVGRLGYLAQANPDEIDEVIEKLNNDNFTFENRLMLDYNGFCALNDIVVKGINCARTSTFDLYINDKKLCSYVADGLIISTPTGSTAYSLSAGGPIISPLLDCFLIIPICPHTLNTRPIVVGADEKIEVRTKEAQKLNVSLDGQVDIVSIDKIAIQKSNNKTRLLILDKQKDKFYDILKEKLHWSIAPSKK